MQCLEQTGVKMGFEALFFQSRKEMVCLKKRWWIYVLYINVLIYVFINNIEENDFKAQALAVTLPL